MDGGIAFPLKSMLSFCNHIPPKNCLQFRHLLRDSPIYCLHYLEIYHCHRPRGWGRREHYACRHRLFDTDRLHTPEKLEPPF